MAISRPLVYFQNQNKSKKKRGMEEKSKKLFSLPVAIDSRMAKRFAAYAGSLILSIEDSCAKREPLLPRSFTRTSRQSSFVRFVYLFALLSGGHLIRFEPRLMTDSLATIWNIDGTRERYRTRKEDPTVSVQRTWNFKKKREKMDGRIVQVNWIR